MELKAISLTSVLFCWHLIVLILVILIWLETVFQMTMWTIYGVEIHDRCTIVSVERSNSVQNLLGIQVQYCMVHTLLGIFIAQKYSSVIIFDLFF